MTGEYTWICAHNPVASLQSSAYRAAGELKEKKT